MKRVLGNKRYILILSVPAFILMAAFVLYPLISIVIMSLQETNGLTPATFAGVDNFVKIFHDNSFIKANIWSIGLCILAIIFNAILAIAVSILLSTLNPKAQKILRTAFIIPLVLSISVVSQLWLAIYHADWGLLNSLLEKAGLGFLRNDWLSNSDTAMICIAIVGMWWSFGLDLLLSYSGIKAIPESCFEAAQLDGASFLATVRYITLPLLKNVAKTCVTVSAVGGLYTFPQVYIMTGGGPGDMTTTIMMYMYKQAFSNMRYGQAAAVGVVAIVETCIVLGIIGWIFKRGRYSEEV